jgi:hypothetical protein
MVARALALSLLLPCNSNGTVQFSQEYQPKNRDLGFDFVLGAAFCLPLLSVTRSVTPLYRSDRAEGYFPLGPPASKSLLAASTLSRRLLRLREGLQLNAACTSLRPSAPYRANKSLTSLVTPTRRRGEALVRWERLL